MKRCSTCQKEKSYRSFYRSKATKGGCSSYCKMCSRQAYAHWRAKNPGAYALQNIIKAERARKMREGVDPQDFKRRWLRYILPTTKHRAEKLGVPFSLTETNMEQQLVDVCPLLGIALDYRPGAMLEGRGRDSSPSLDRLIPSRGYTPQNVYVISWRANRIKCDATLEELRMITEGVERMLEDEALAYSLSEDRAFYADLAA